MFTNVHGLSKTKIYQCWSDIKQRCYNKNNRSYKNYGSRGISVCDEWINKENGFKNFYEWAINNGYCENLTIDRIDVNGNYQPDNCRWVTMKVQCNNRRNNHLITIDNITHTLEEWIEIKQLNKNMILHRVKRSNNDDNLLKEKIDCNRYLTIDNETHSISEWSKISGIPKSTIISRLHRGWSEKDSLKPVTHKKI